MQRWEFKQELEKQFPAFYEYTLSEINLRGGDLTYDWDFAEVFLHNILSERITKRYYYIAGCEQFNGLLYAINNSYESEIQDRVSNQYVFNFIKRNEDALIFAIL